VSAIYTAKSWNTEFTTKNIKLSRTKKSDPANLHRCLNKMSFI
jgi:hypothetical protein